MDSSIPMNIGASAGGVVKHEHAHDHHHKHHHKEGKHDMLGSVGGTPVITGGDGAGMGLGAGLGGGLLGGILGGALLGNRNGLFGNGGNVEGAVTPSQLTSALAGVTSSASNDVIKSMLGTIQGSIPLAEGQTQLALQSAQDDITSQNQAQTLALTNQNFQGQLAMAAGFASTKDATDSLSTQVAIGQGVTNTNIERLGWQLSMQINADGDKTRALIQSIDKQNDMARITAQAAEIAELRFDRSRTADTNGIRIEMINNQNQLQMQQQQQANNIGVIVNALAGLSQNIQATNQAINIGGLQQANPTNTNTNVRT